MKHLQVTLEKITPEKARAILAANNGSNRALREKRVMKYALDMAEGRWLQTGDTVKFFTDGDLADGQHRLAAVDLANVSIDFHIARGLPREVEVGKKTLRPMDCVDQGASRSIADQLHIGHGLKYGQVISASLRRIAMLCQPSFVGLTPTLAIEMLGIFAKQIDEIRDALTVGPKHPMLRAYFVAPLAFYAISEREKAVKFARELATMEMSATVATFRRWYENHHTKKQTDVTIHTLINALRAYDENRHLRKIYASDDARAWLLNTSPGTVRKVKSLIGTLPNGE